MFRNETAVPGAMFGDFPGPAEVRARTRGQSEIAGARRVEQLQQLARCVGHVRLPRAGQQFAVIELRIPAQTEWVVILRLIAD